MALLAWKENYSVNIRKFDEQHKRLIDLINQLHDAMMVGKGKEVMGDVLNSLVDYTKTHFSAEEALMKLHNYPDYEHHKKEHNMLVMQVLDVQKQFREGKTPMTQAIMFFLKEWLQQHIQGNDKKYGPFLNNKGIA